MRRAILLAAIVCCSMVAGCTKTEKELREIIVAKSSLMDPYSTQFRDVRYGAFGLAGKYEMWAGEINAKNRMGAYVGWKRFYINRFDGKQTFFFVEPEADEGLASLSPKLAAVQNLMAQQFEREYRRCYEAGKPLGKWRFLLSDYFGGKSELPYPPPYPKG